MLRTKRNSMSFAHKLLNWFDGSGRKDLPWQRDRTFYRVWVSEVMLQQTQVNTVIPYFKRFISRFPDIYSLARASLDDVLHLWSGLGYYSRARNLHKTAQLVCDYYEGEFPHDIDNVVSLPGIGRSTAGAILALSKGERQPILDGNVKRVLCRYHAIEGRPGQTSIEKKLWQLAEEHTPYERISEYTQAIMDLGATLCRRRRPHCGLCPFEEDCLAHARGEEEKYPNRKSSGKIPVHESVFLVIRGEEKHLLLEKRPPAGIWGGLWSFPQLSHLNEIDQWCGREGLQILEKEALPPFRHTFSHFHLEINPVKLKVVKADLRTVREGAFLQWHSPEEIEKIGLPAPVKKLL